VGGARRRALAGGGACESSGVVLCALRHGCDSPSTYRLPTYYTVNLQFEKRFHLFGRYWALRGGFDNVTNHANAALANGIIDAVHPAPTFIDANGRAFTGRIRYLGRQ
jgi:hypothetical protein